jgi:hypothetical protein
VSDFQVPIRQSPENFRKTLNTILARFEDLLPGVGSALPASAPDGRFFTETGLVTNTLYQRINGNWEPV